MGVAPPPTHFSLRPQPCRQAPRQDVGAEPGPHGCCDGPAVAGGHAPFFLLRSRAAPQKVRPPPRTVQTARWNDPRYPLPQGTTGPGTVKDPIQVPTPPKSSYEIQERIQSS